MADVGQPRVEERLPIYLADDEITLAWELADKHGIGPEVRTATYTGLRMTELRMMEWQHVNLVARYLVVPRSKGKRPRQVPLCQPIIDVLEAWRPRAGWSAFVFPGGRLKGHGKRGRGIWGDMPRGQDWWCGALAPLQEVIPAFRRLPKGSTGRGWHLFRHSFATRCARRGVSIYKLSKWLGHRSISTTQIYAHLAEGYDADIERLA